MFASATTRQTTGLVKANNEGRTPHIYQKLNYTKWSKPRRGSKWLFGSSAHAMNCGLYMRTSTVSNSAWQLETYQRGNAIFAAWQTVSRWQFAFPEMVISFLSAIKSEHRSDGHFRMSLASQQVASLPSTRLSLPSHPIWGWAIKFIVLRYFTY